MLSGLGNLEACFLFRIKAFFIEHRDTMISSAPSRVGTMRRPICTPSCSTETMAVPPSTIPRRGT
jgi:hypothetical protein